MRRFLLLRESNGNRSGHGTALELAEDTFITSHPIGDDMGSKYFVSRDGTTQNISQIVRFSELKIPVEGAAELPNQPPYFYQLELEKPLPPA
jgi:hypothetical protein